MGKNKKLEKRIARNILKNTLDASSFVFSTLIEMSEMTIEVFLNPSCYNDGHLSGGEVFINIQSGKNKKVKLRTIKQSIRRLKKQGFVEEKNNRYSLTATGKVLADYIVRRKKNLDKKWDKKFRLVVFDVPEKQRKDRDWLRKELYLLNYKQLQKSVFISRLPLTEDLIKEIKRKKLSNFVNYLLVDKVYDYKDRD